MIESALFTKPIETGPDLVLDPVEYGKFTAWLTNTVSGKLYQQRTITTPANVEGGAGVNAYHKLTMNPPTGVMTGSPTTAYAGMNANAPLGRVAQHSIPTEEAFQFNVDNRLMVAIRSYTGTSKWILGSVTKNGYTSLSIVGNTQVVNATVVWIIYYDPVLRKMMQCNPAAQTVSEFTFPA